MPAVASPSPPHTPSIFRSLCIALTHGSDTTQYRTLTRQIKKRKGEVCMMSLDAIVASLQGKASKSTASKKRASEASKVTHILLLDSELHLMKRYLTWHVQHKDASPPDEYATIPRILQHLELISEYHQSIDLTHESWIHESIASGYLLSSSEFAVDLEQMRRRASEIGRSVTRIRKRKRRRVDLSAEKRQRVGEEADAVPSLGHLASPDSHKSIHFDTSMTHHASNSSQKEITTCVRLSQDSPCETDIVLVLNKAVPQNAASSPNTSTTKRTTDPTPTRSRQHTKKSSQLLSTFHHRLQESKSEFMHACCAYFSNLSNARIRELSLDLRTHGATIMPVLDRRVTHVILPSALEHDLQLPSNEYQYIQQHGYLKVVTLTWLSDCIEEQQLLHDAKYFIPIDNLTDYTLRRFEERAKKRDIFLGKTFHISDATPPQDAYWLRHMIPHCSGHLVENLHQCVVDYVVGPFNSEKPIDTRSQNVGAYVTVHFVRDCINAGQLHTVSSSDSPFYWTPFMFERDVVAWCAQDDLLENRKGKRPMFCIAGMEDTLAECVEVLLDMMGCACCKELDEHTCDSLIVDQSRPLPLELVRAAHEKNVVIVDTEWLSLYARFGEWYDWKALDATKLLRAPSTDEDDSLPEPQPTLQSIRAGFSHQSTHHSLPNELPLSNTPTHPLSTPPTQPNSDSSEFPSSPTAESGYLSEEFDDDDDGEGLPEDMVELVNLTRCKSLNAAASLSGTRLPETVNRHMLRLGMTQHLRPKVPTQTQSVVHRPANTLAPNAPIVYIHHQTHSVFRDRLKHQITARLHWELRESWEDCTHVVCVHAPSGGSQTLLTLQASAKIVVSADWLQACEDAGYVVPLQPYALAHTWERPAFEGWVVFPRRWRPKFLDRVGTLIRAGQGRVWDSNTDLNQVTHILTDDLPVVLGTNEEIERYNELKRQGVREYKVQLLKDYLMNPEKAPM